VTQSILVENLPDEAGWVTFDDTGTLVAVASDRDVKVFVIERKEVLVTLEGHLARVSGGRDQGQSLRVEGSALRSVRGVCCRLLEASSTRSIITCCSPPPKIVLSRYPLLTWKWQCRTGSLISECTQIWDLAARTLWFQSTVLSAFSILSIALNPVNGDAAFGFADGSVKVFELLDGYAKELTALNVELFVRKSLRKRQVRTHLTFVALFACLACNKY